MTPNIHGKPTTTVGVNPAAPIYQGKWKVKATGKVGDYTGAKIPDSGDASGTKVTLKFQDGTTTQFSRSELERP
jgi:hypothetical protein